MSGTKNKHKTKQPKVRRKLLLTGVTLGTIGLLLVWILRDIPNPKRLTSDVFPESSQVLDRKGQLLYEIYSEKRRTPVALSEIPDNLKKATLAIEDTNFYSHNGFDWKGILRGLYRTIFLGRKQGGSTLTQQLVKNALLTPERTWQRKIREAILTVATETIYTKNQILEMYFNQTPYGGTMWGVGAAAKGIFDKDIGNLTLAESAMIAGLPGSPTAYSPFAHPDAAKKRQQLVLARMEEVGYISKEQKQQAEEEKIIVHLNRNKILAPHFVFYVKEQLIDKYGVKRVNEGGLKVTTSLDWEIQDYAQKVIATEVAKLHKHKVGNAAALITEPKTGEILAMVGSKDYFAEDIDGKYNVTTSLRQPGSSIKPLNYAVGLELGKVTAATVFDDGRTCFIVENQRPYCPTNYGEAYHGIQTLRNSLANSLNIPAVKMLKINGLQTFVASASAMGIESYNEASDYGLSLTLGGGEARMTEMVTAFGMLANMGIRQDLISILKIVDKEGNVLEERQFVPGERILSRETGFIIGQILSDDGARSMVFGRGSMLNIKGHPEVSVKTGTTNDMRDNWTIGYSPDYVVATWVGNNDNSKMGGLVSGTTGAAPIWNTLMTYLLKNKSVKKPIVPTEVLSISVCNLTGLLPPESGCESHFEYFKKEFAPKRQASLRENVPIDRDTGNIVAESENKPNVEWQDHAVVVEATGARVCLDCPLVGVGDSRPTVVVR